MSLIYDIKLARTQSNTLSCLMLDIKEAFDHVSTNQLLKIMTKLQLLKQVQSWTKSFLEKRKAELAFNEEKQEI